MLLGPIFQILFFAYLGRFAKLRDNAFFAVGNSVDMACTAGIFAGVMVIANEASTRPLRRYWRRRRTGWRSSPGAPCR